MGGSEIGFIGGPGVETVGRINEELALEAAQEKADRTVFAFRRTRVFDKTFRQTLDELNRVAGINPEFIRAEEEEF